MEHLNQVHKPKYSSITDLKIALEQDYVPHQVYVVVNPAETDFEVFEIGANGQPDILLYRASAEPTEASLPRLICVLLGIEENFIEL